MDSWQPADEVVFKERLFTASERFGVRLTEGTADRLLRQLRLVLDANRSLNLTSVRNPHEALIKHTVDSMAFFPAYHRAAGRYLDLGTGGGYPGMVLEILEPRPGVLLDSITKKIAACRRIGGELGIQDIDYVDERVEAYAIDHRDEFGVITARAVAPLGELLEYASPLAALGGIFIAGKARLPQDEEAQGLRVAEILGFENVSRETFELPEAMGRRTMLVYQKVRESSVLLPRAIGRAKKRPLWRCTSFK